MAAVDLHYYRSLIKKLVVVEGKTYDECSHFLSSILRTGVKGISSRSIRRFCAENNLLSLRSVGRRFTETEVDVVIAKSISEVLWINSYENHNYYN